MTLRSLLVFTAVALLSAGPEAAEVSWEIDPVPRAMQWAPDGPILEFVEHDGILYLAGTFDYVGRPTGSIGRFDVSSGEVDLDLPKTDGEVYVIARDGMGGWIVGGEFARVGSAARSNLARFDSQWQLTDWAPLVNAPVWCIEVDGNDVYLGGEFFSISGIERRYVARLDLSTGQVHAWSPTATSPPQNFDVVRAILVSGDVVYFGGDFETIIGGQERRHLAAVHADTGALLAFDANPDGAVFSLEEHSSGVVAAGNFDVIGGKLRKRLAVVDPVTGVAQGLDVSFSSDVLTTELDGDVLYCGGIFAEVAGLSRSRAAAIDLVGGAVLPWNPSLTGKNGVSLEDLEVTSNSVLLAGRFHEVSGQPRRHLAEVSKTTGLPTSLAVGASGPPNPRLRAVVRDSSTITVAGDFRILGLEVRRGFAAIDLETEDLLPLAPTFTDMNSGLSESVRALAFCGGSIFVGGTFDHVNGILHPRLAKIDASTGALDPTFDLGFPFNAGIPGPLACDGKLLLMGVYTPSTAGSGVSAWDASTGALRWRIKTNSALRDIVFSNDGSKVFAAGTFNEAESAPGVFVPRHRLLAVDAASGALDSVWTPAASDNVTDLCVFGDFVFATGSFLTIDSKLIPHVVRLRADDGEPTAWPVVPSDSVSSIFVNRDLALLQGSFTHIGNQYVPKLAAVDTESGALLPWAPMDSSVAGLALVENRLYVVGNDGQKYQSVPLIAPLVLDFLSLTADVDRLSVSAGGQQHLSLDVGGDFAGKAYWTLGSLSGSFPGTPITSNVDLPLNADGYFFCSLFDPLATPIVQHFGILDSEGRAAPSILLPPGTTPAFVGVTLRHACAVFDPITAEPLLVSNPTGLLLDP